MKLPPLLASLFLTVLAVTANADDAQAAAIEAFRNAAQTCKTAPNQSIAFDLVDVEGAPVSVPATPEELARVKDLLAKSNLPYDPINHRVSYEFVLALTRARKAGQFTVRSTVESADLMPVKDCLAELAGKNGLEFRFE